MTITQMAVGQTWVGNALADYSWQMQNDPANPRAIDVTYHGRKCVALRLDNADMPLAAEPRVQGVSNITLPFGGHYIEDVYINIPHGDLPVWTNGDFLEFNETYGAPFTTSPPLSIATRDGKTWGLYAGTAGADGNPRTKYGQPLAMVPISIGDWEPHFTFEYDLVRSGELKISYHGNMIYQCSRFEDVNAGDARGPIHVYPQIYMRRGLVPDGQIVGPVYTYVTVHRTS